MKHIALVVLFATSLVAQQAAEPVRRGAQLELAKIFAVEEQEQDLSKAVHLYRAALEDKGLSGEARTLARERLGKLLRRLGKHKQARQVLDPSGKGAVVSLDDVTNGTVQDPERFKKLQLQARALLAEARKNRGPGAAGQHATGTSVSEQLLWIGAPAVPEVLAVLEGNLDKPRHTGLTYEMVSFLWQQGGASAEKFLARAAQAALAPIVADYAGLMKVVDIESPVVRAYLDHDNWPLTRRFLTGQRSGSVEDRLSIAQLLQFAERGDDHRKSHVLRLLPSRKLSDEDRRRAYALCRQAQKGADPELGKSAERFVISHQSQQTMEGLRMLFAILPKLHARGTGPAPYWPANSPSRSFEADQAAQILPMIREAVPGIGSVEARSPVANWLMSLMYAMPQDAGTPCTELLIRMWDLGYDVVFALQGRATQGVAVALLERFDRVEKTNRWRFFNAFDARSLTPAALPALRKAADSVNWWQDSGTMKRICGMAAQTECEDAAAFLLKAWAKGDPKRFVRDEAKALTDALIGLAKNVRTEAVQAAMRKMALGDGGPQVGAQSRSRLVLVLMSMGDEAILDYVASGGSHTEVAHPFAVNPRLRGVTTIKYLIYQEPNPPHGYRNEQVLDVATRWVNKTAGKNSLNPMQMARGRIADDVLVALARGDGSDYSGWSWPSVALQRLEKKLAAGEDAAVLEHWFLAETASPTRRLNWFDASKKAVGRRYRDAIEKVFANADDGQSAYHAARWLWQIDRSIDVVKALKHRHLAVRGWALAVIAEADVQVDAKHVIPLLSDRDEDLRERAADHLGAQVCKPGVPALIECLRDPEEQVRKAAADALTRIRFYHEQQAHWDRVLKGLDASPASAAEKLLVQAKPAAKKSQRLLAIKSLGVLGVPEALPFLIEWSQEEDSEIRAAADAAITAIHLKPRK